MNASLAPLYAPSRAPLARAARRLVQWRTAAPLPATPRRLIVSVTFDDFPKSAVEYGADIVESVGGRAAFFAATGLAGRQTPIGHMFDSDDLKALERAGHEIGAHSRRHRNAATADAEQTLRDVQDNLSDLARLGVSSPIQSFAYPYGETTCLLKHRLKTRFTCARGVLAGVNRRGSDAMQLRAIELTETGGGEALAHSAIRAAASRPAWVILFTHDVRRAPSAFGVTPERLRRVVRHARDAGAVFLTPREAMAEIGSAV